MPRTCCYCKEDIHHDFFNHLATCDGTPRQSMKERRQELVAERTEMDRQIKILTERKVSIQLQIDQIDILHVNQQKLKL